jgi:plastocyanin
VAVGTTVTWTNDDDEPTPPPRTPACGTADRSRPEPPPSWTFDEAGAYPYHCTFHGGPGTGMSGTVVVS